MTAFSSSKLFSNMNALNKKEETGKKNLSIPPTPNPIFLVELNEYILLTGFPINECIFPLYVFDNDCDGAFEAANNIAKEDRKFIIDAVNYHLYDPHIYDPIAIDIKIENIVNAIFKARASIRGNLEKDNEIKG